MRGQAVFGAWGIALALMLALVAPAGAAAGPTRLSGQSATPGSGTTLTTIAFAVTYRNREGSPADWVRVRVAGATHAMSASGSAWKAGVRFSWSGKLPAGTHAVTFEGMSRDRFTAEIAGGSVTITAPPTPAPTAKPTPKPSPRATAAPTPRPTATPRPTPTPRPAATTTPTGTAPPAATATPRPDPASTSAPAASPAPTGDAAPPQTAAPTSSATPSDGTVAYVPGAATNHGGPGPDGRGDRPVGPAGEPGTDPGPLGALASAISAFDGARPVVPLGLVATLVTTSGIVGTAMAFGVFGKRRRDGEQPESDEVLAVAAGTGMAVANAYGFADPKAAADAAAAALLLDPELGIPRWRRPSLLEARRADPTRDVTAPARLTFDHGLVGALEGRERRLIGYNVVRLLDSPDELRGAEIGFLDQGDQVQLLEKRGVYWLVLCPDGREGWIHKMTLGEVVGQVPDQSPPTATMPIAAETWTMGDDVDGDVLTAYLESRRRA